MNSELAVDPPKWSIAAWLAVVLAGIAAPVAALGFIATPAAVPLSLTVGIMGGAMIGAAAAGRLLIGVLLAVLISFGLLAVASAFGMAIPHNALAMGLVICIAAFSFAARGALFSRSVPGIGWLIAVFVVVGEVAIILTALAKPGALPAWLLVLLPAQWTNVAIQSALSQMPLTQSGMLGAAPVLIALAGTAAATLFAARMLPKRWPYLIMFSTWLSLSAVVWYWPV